MTILISAIYGRLLISFAVDLMYVGFTLPSILTNSSTCGKVLWRIFGKCPDRTPQVDVEFYCEQILVLQYFRYSARHDRFRTCMVVFLLVCALS